MESSGDELYPYPFPPNPSSISYQDIPAPSYLSEALALAQKDNPDLFHPVAYMVTPLSPAHDPNFLSSFDGNSLRYYKKPPRLGPRPQYIQKGQVSMNRYSSFARNTSEGEYDPNCVPEYAHEIVFDDNGFTVDGKSRDINDPRYLPFLESLNKYECPDEFDQPGLHTITVYGRLSFDKEFLHMQAKQKEKMNQCPGYPVNHKWLDFPVNHKDLTGFRVTF